MNASATLALLNFTLAGAREGFGPFLGVYLQGRGFDPAATGFAMSVAGVAGLLATAPIGRAVDTLKAKRTALAAAVLAISIGSLILVATDHMAVIGIAQAFIGVADTSLAPLIAALTLGLVGQDAYKAQVSRNEAANHGGNAANAALAGLLGYWLGLGYVTIAIVVMAVATCGVLTRVDPERIDHDAARGGGSDDRSTLAILAGSRPLIVLAACTLALQAANGAMLPFLAQARTAAGADPSVVTAVMVVIAQVSAVGAALVAHRLSEGRGLELVLTLALVVAIVRGGLAAVTNGWLLLVPVQILDGVAVGLGGVAIPALVARIMAGTGHANAGLGAVMTAYGVGAAVSPLIAGGVASAVNFPAAFLSLAGVAGLGLVLWLARSVFGGALPENA